MENENNRYEEPNTSSQAPSGATSDSYGMPDSGETQILGTDAPNAAGSFYAPPNSIIPPKKKKKWPVIAGVGGAVVVAAGAAATYWFMFRTPSFDTPTEAITTCISQLEEQFSTKELGINTLEKKLDSAALLEAMGKQGAQIDMELTFDGSSIDNLSMFEGTTVNFSSANDVKNNRSKSSIEASFLGIGGDIGIYTDQDMLALTSDEFLADSYLSINKEELVDFMKNASEEELDILQSFWEQNSTQLITGITDLSDYAWKQLPDSMVSFAKDWDARENEKKDTLKINKKNYDCHTYEISITAEAFQKFADDYCNYLADYDFDKNVLFTTLEAYLSESDQSIDLADTIQNALRHAADEIDTSSDDTLDFTMYVSPEGKMLGVDIDLNNEDDTLVFELRFGGKNPGQDIYMNYSLDADGTSMNYNLSCIRAVKNDVETMDYNLSMTIDEEEVLKLDMDSDYNAEDDSISSSVNACINDGSSDVELTLDMEGVYKDIQKGTGYTLSYDTLSASVDSADISGSIELSGDVSLDTKNISVKKPSGTNYNLLSMDDASLEDLLKTLKKSSTLSMVLDELTVEDLKELFESIISSAQTELEDYSDMLEDDMFLLDEDILSDDELLDDELLDDEDSTDNNDHFGTLEDYLNSEEMQDSMELLQSMLEDSGMTMEITAQGNIMTYTYTYTNLTASADAKKQLEDGLTAQASTFETTAESIASETGIEDVIIRVQYIDKNGTLICQQDFCAD